MAKQKPLSKAAFLARMREGRLKAAAARARAAGKQNPAKLERCVKAVKKSGKAVNAYAVCTAAQKKNAGKSFRKLKKSLKKKGRGSAELAKLKRDIRGASKALRGNSGQRKNPVGSAAAKYEEWHGKEPGEVVTIDETIHEHSVLSGIGKLGFMKIAAINSPHVVTLSGFKGALLAQDEKSRQLFIKGGDQKVNLSDFGIDKDRAHIHELLGALEEISYFTEKLHLRPEDGGKAEYVHKFGKNKSRLPMVGYDTDNRLLTIEGGGYDLPEVGIRG
jgi:hypothetical protein